MSERADHVRLGGAVIDRMRLRRGNRRPHGLRVGDVDGLPLYPGEGHGLRSAGAMPRDDVRSSAGQQIEQMAAGKSSGPSDEGGAQRGSPLIAPLNGEKFPSPANVNDRKNR